jgi:hypothetical protein
MYSEILAKALEVNDDAQPAIRTKELLQAVNDRRAAFFGTRTGTSGAIQPEERVASEIAYDVAILRLCAAVGIDASPARFSHPRSERAELIRKLAQAGVPLRAEGKRFRRPAGRPTGGDRPRPDLPVELPAPG